MATATQEASEACCSEVCIEKVQDLIRKNVYASIGVGFIPIPIIDLLSVSAIQLNMLKKLADMYGIEYKKETVRGILGALVGGVVPVATAGTCASLLKVIPVVGYTTSAVSMSIMSGASTYAVGWVFAQHFASGGTFLDFDPESVREYFSEKFEEGKKVAKEAKKSS